MMKKALIFGSNGLLGQSLCHTFKSEYEICGASLEDENYLADFGIKYDKIDLTNRISVKEYISAEKPDLIINAAAFTNVDKCESEKELCWAVNVKAVENIVEGAQLAGSILIHISTDYVFDGNKPPYSENDTPNPRGNYARSKMAAENIVKGGGVDYIIARTQVLFGTGNNVRPNFVTWVVDQLGKKRTIKIVTDQIGNPTYVPDLSEGIRRLLNKGSYGLFHISGPDSLSRYDFALLIAKVFGRDSSYIEATDSSQFKQLSPRPANSTFRLEKLINYSEWRPQSLESALQSLKNELERKNG